MLTGSGLYGYNLNISEGWEELYSEWKRKKITTTEFLRKSGLKKATFYSNPEEYADLIGRW